MASPKRAETASAEGGEGGEKRGRVIDAGEGVESWIPLATFDCSRAGVRNGRKFEWVGLASSDVND